MNAMNNQGIEERIKLACFRTITDQLFERNLITKEELKRITQRLEQMEIDLIRPESQEKPHPRKISLMK